MANGQEAAAQLRRANELFSRELQAKLECGVGNKISSSYYLQVNYPASAQVSNLRYRVGNVVRDQVLGGIFLLLSDRL